MNKYITFSDLGLKALNLFIADKIDLNVHNEIVDCLIKMAQNENGIIMSKDALAFFKKENCNIKDMEFYYEVTL